LKQLKRCILKGEIRLDELDSRVYYGYKDATRKAVKNIAEDNLKWNNMPIILVDFYSWEVFYFEDEYEAKEHLEKHNTQWDDEPPNGEDEELVIFKYCTEEEKKKFEFTYRNFTFYKEINGKRIYRQRSFVEFEPELIINVSI
jgi:hypothetical protein